MNEVPKAVDYVRAELKRRGISRKEVARTAFVVEDVLAKIIFGTISSDAIHHTRFLLITAFFAPYPIITKDDISKARIKAAAG